MTERCEDKLEYQGQTLLCQGPKGHCGVHDSGDFEWSTAAPVAWGMLREQAEKAAEAARAVFQRDGLVDLADHFEDFANAALAATPAPATQGSALGALRKLFACFDDEGHLQEAFQDQLSVALEESERALSGTATASRKDDAPR